MIYRKLLIIHDSRVVRNILKGYALAELDDIQIVEARSGQEAIMIAEDEKLDIVLCGIYLKDFDGSDIRRKIKSSELNRNTPVIIFTSMTSEKHIAEIKAQGVRHYLQSPFTSTELKTVIDKACDPRRSRKLQRYSVQDAQAIIHFPSQDISSEIINFSAKSFFVELALPPSCRQILDSVNLSIQFPEEYDALQVDDVFCKLHSFRTLQWREDYSPELIRAVWLIEDITVESADSFDKVLSMVEEKYKKLHKL